MSAARGFLCGLCGLCALIVVTSNRRSELNVGICCVRDAGQLHLCMVVGAREAPSREPHAVGSRACPSFALVVLRRAPVKARERRRARGCRQAGRLCALLWTVALPCHT